MNCVSEVSQFSHPKCRALFVGSIPTPRLVYEKGGTSTASVPYIVRVTATDLYIRRGAGTNYGTNGFIKPGVYTIVEEQDGQGATKWGKLKSGAGWISLDFVQKL